MPQVKRNPARVCAKAGEVCRRNNGGLAASGDLHSTILEKQKALAKKQPEARAKFTDTRLERGVSVGEGSPCSAAGTIATNAWPLPKKDARKVRGVVTPLDHDAHRSPANQVDANTEVGLRRKSESNCVILETKIPDSIAARPGIISKRPPAKVCATQRYQNSNLSAIGQKEGPASGCWTGPKDCGFRAAGAQAGVDSRCEILSQITFRYRVFQNLLVQVLP